MATVDVCFMGGWSPGIRFFLSRLNRLRQRAKDTVRHVSAPAFSPATPFLDFRTVAERTDNEVDR
jgi:hypothetical protein